MGRECTICCLPACQAIDAALRSGTHSISQLARAYGVTRQALMRHRADHLPEASLAAVAAELGRKPVPVDDEPILDQVRRLGHQAKAMMARAYDMGDLRSANIFLESARRCLELQAKVLGEIGDGGVTINLHQTTEYRLVVLNIVRALDPYPDARAAVLAALGDEVPVIEGAQPVPDGDG